MRLSVFLVVAVLIAGMAGCVGVGSQNLEIWDWYDLDAIRDNLESNHKLMNDLDSTTPGYTELASPTADHGKGWQPIGTRDEPFTGTFDGQGYEIGDLYINRPEERRVGLFGIVETGGVIENVGVVNANVTGDSHVGGLVGQSSGNVSNSYSTGSVAGEDVVGGLVGSNEGPVSNSHFIGNVNSDQVVGGLVGGNGGPVSDSYSIGNVTGRQVVGGLLGTNAYNSVSNCYFTGSVTGEEIVGGLMGENEDGTISNSYSTGSVTGTYLVGGLMACNYGGIINNCYSTGTVSGEQEVGGLLGHNSYGTISNSYSTGIVTGTEAVGGLVGLNKFDSVVNSSFWDIETSGQAASDGGTGKNATEMQNIATFSGAGWNIIAVALNETNPAYIWNIVNNMTYPFLSWQS